MPRKEFVRDGVPVHLVTIEQLRQPPRKTVEIEGITTVSLEDLIEMKLRSGSSNVLRAQDLADAIGLIRHHRLTGEFAAISTSPAPTFRKLIKELKRERRLSTTIELLARDIRHDRIADSTNGFGNDP